MTETKKSVETLADEYAGSVANRYSETVEYTYVYQGFKAGYSQGRADEREIQETDRMNEMDVVSDANDKRLADEREKAYKEGFEDALQKAARLVWDTIDGKNLIAFHAGSTALGNAVQEIEREDME